MAWTTACQWSRVAAKPAGRRRRRRRLPKCRHHRHLSPLRRGSPLRQPVAAPRRASGPAARAAAGLRQSRRRQPRPLTGTRPRRQQHQLCHFLLCHFRLCRGTTRIRCGCRRPRPRQGAALHCAYRPERGRGRRPGQGRRLPRRMRRDALTGPRLPRDGLPTASRWPQRPRLQGRARGAGGRGGRRERPARPQACGADGRGKARPQPRPPARPRARGPQCRRWGRTAGPGATARLSGSWRAGRPSARARRTLREQLPRARRAAAAAASRRRSLAGLALRAWPWRPPLRGGLPAGGGARCRRPDLPRAWNLPPQW